MFKINIHRVSDHGTIKYATDELAKYLAKMSACNVQTDMRLDYDPSDDSGLWVGMADSFPEIKMPDVEEPRIDDAVYIDVRGGNGIIAGVNPRSVLFAVYRYLTELGCRWVRPGANGEFIPNSNIHDVSVNVVEAASYRHRGICIEGAVSYEHLKDIIEWAPRVGFNEYFIQFREGYEFFDRWYSHRDNPQMSPEGFSIEKARELVSMAVEEMKKRDLLYHAIGHGWTCEPLGIRGLGWDQTSSDDLPPDAARYLALVDGERKLWHGVPLNTNLCYSNPEVRRLIVKEIATYALAHPEIDFLHFWLADGSNNHCECGECRKARPSDFYVQILNELDDTLTEMGLNTRIVFLIYVDLLWPPEFERIKNPDRFVLMFAPITRTYSRPFAMESALPELSPYKRNQLVFPRSVEENVAYLRAWQKIFGGDSFDFDYHYMWDHYNDPGYMQIAKVLHSDIQHLRDIGLNGYISCQTQRAFFPTGLGMVTMGWTLWNSRISFEDIVEDYFRAAFGQDGEKCYEYLKQLTDLFDPVYLRGEKTEVDPQAVRAFNQVQKLIEEFEPTIARNIGLNNACQAYSWRYLQQHADICKALAHALEARARGDRDLAIRRWESVKSLVWSREDILHRVFDVWLFINTVGRKFNA